MPKGARDNNRTMLPAQRPHRAPDPKSASHGTDFLARGIALSAAILLLGIAGAVIAAIIDELTGNGPGPNRLLVSALLLNIALVLLGWRRHRELTDELANRCRAEEKARLLSETDALTGLLNRRSFRPAVDKVFTEAAQNGLAVAVVMVDLDNFKQVNDTNGHAAGDTLLIEAAQRIADVLPAGSLLARLGGDEFACAFCYFPTRTEEVDRLVSKMSDTVARPVRFAGFELETTISVGIAGQLPHACDNALAALHSADIAMYHAKKRGRNRHCWFDPAMEQELRYRRSLETALRRAIANEEFVPFYQPQVDLDTGLATGVELLARWDSTEFGEIGPDIFIPIAEEVGLIEALSEQLIRKALRDSHGWDNHLSLAVNISPCQLRDPWFAHKLLKLLVEANFPPSRLEVEVSESALAERSSTVLTTIASLKNQGIQVALDNFGTGHSSLSQLRSVPFDRLKIDRSLIATVRGSKESAAIVSSIVSLGKGLGLPITAEGIENQETLEHLVNLGIARGQGFLLGLPQTAEEILSVVTASGKSALEVASWDVVPAARIA